MINLFKEKYKNYMKKVSEKEWKYILQCANNFNQKPQEVIFNNCISISRSEIKDYPKFQEELINTKMVKDVSKHGYETRYKLTKKGLKELI